MNILRIRGGAVHTDTTAVMIFIRVARARKIYFRTSCEVVNVQTIDRRYSFRFGHCFSQCESYTFMYIYKYIRLFPITRHRCTTFPYPQKTITANDSYMFLDVM